MTRETQNVLLLLVGGAILTVTLRGEFTRYVKPSLMPYLLISGAVIVVLAVAAAVRDMRRGPGARGDHGEHSHGPEGVHWALVAPIAVVLFVAPPALGASSIGTSTQSTTAEQTDGSRPPLTAFAPLPPGDAPEVPLVDVAQRSARDTAGTLDEREITVSGFVVATANGGTARAGGEDGGLDLARIVITCCVADARTVRIHLDPTVRDIPDGTWVSVRGVVETGSANPDTRWTPTMSVTNLTRIPAPDNTYEY